MSELDYSEILLDMELVDLESEKEYIKSHQHMVFADGRRGDFTLDSHSRFVHRSMNWRTDLRRISYDEAIVMIDDALRVRTL